MEESLQCSHNLPRHRRMWQASILVRALVHGWRHTGRSLVGVDIIEVLHLVAEAGGRSSSTTPKPPAQPLHRERVGGSRELRSCAALRLRSSKSADPS